MNEVVFTKTVSFKGAMYLKGTRTQISDEELKHLQGRYELVSPPKNSVRSTAVLEPKKTVVMESPKPKTKRKRSKRSKKSR